MIENHWQLQEAKNKFSSLIDKAQKIGPQIVTRHGKDVVIILSIEEYNKLKKPETSLVNFFRNSPLAEENLELERTNEKPRDVEI
jgi:prevent-host-death family protein